MSELEILAALETHSDVVPMIVRAVNTHQDLILALKTILDIGLDGTTARAARRVLSLAEGRTV